MSTMLEDHVTHYVVSTVVGKGRRRKMARLRVLVPKGDRAALRQEIQKQAVAARLSFGLVEPVQEPVV